MMASMCVCMCECAADYTVESVFALPDEDIFLCMIIRQTGMGSGHVETDRCGMGDTLVLVQTRQLLYCIREQLLYRQDRAADDDSSQSVRSLLSQHHHCCCCCKVPLP